jgi:hypothetical protein
MFDWGHTKKEVGELWIYTPDDSSLVKHQHYGRINLKHSK